MLVTFIDLETNGLPEQPEAMPIEVACVTVDFTAKRVVRAFSETVNFFGPLTVSEDTQKVHGMTTEFVQKHGITGETGAGVDFYMRLNEAMTKVDAVFARNGMAFDKIMLSRIFKPNAMPQVIWIDDYLDLQYPEWVKGRSLGHIAADHGFLNPFAHSALGDTMTLAYVMLKGGYDIAAMIESAKSPLVQVQALVEYNEKDHAKKAGFQWHANRKIWVKIMRQAALDKIAATLPFRTVSREVSSEQLANFYKEMRQ